MNARRTKRKVVEQLPGDDDNEPTPPFDFAQDFIGSIDLHEAHRRVREPDSALDVLRPHATPQQIDDLHAYFLGVWEKHHGRG